ncbi:hypothetical protein C475_16481 [Halosimplex carlsbadense 2-9-1]|uniref:Uncharacterized protein n=1 Tax=Halosimplex carlsbadense 2-9-1 TaxID=797114 RepID=M0CHK7_9EURY|nr:hypothetical protein [Halosimplex carlsbadense]ELZ22716.1 hypothetical protein C475_16481 [Halosimplex carlsbadense 2-9-1]
MQCANCRADGEPAYTLRAHVDADDDGDGQEDDEAEARTDGGASATVDLPFCSLECLTAWT